MYIRQNPHHGYGKGDFTGVKKVNGRITDKFNSGRDCRHGNHISGYIFILCIAVQAFWLINQNLRLTRQKTAEQNSMKHRSIILQSIKNITKTTKIWKEKNENTYLMLQKNWHLVQLKITEGKNTWRSLEKI